MNDKEQSVMQQAFETWWENDGQEFLYALNTTTDDDIRLVARFAWESGAYYSKQTKQAEIPEWVDVDDYEEQEQEPVACIRGLTDQCATLIQECDELQKKVWQYEKHGVTCQLYGHKIERSCAECNVDENYAAPVRTKDLTDDEIVDASGIGCALPNEIDRFRAVIAADREKNK